MKKLMSYMLGDKPLSTIGLIILTVIVYGAIALMAVLYLMSPTISGERMF